jgi:hypothetical protein
MDGNPIRRGLGFATRERLTLSVRAAEVEVVLEQLARQRVELGVNLKLGRNLGRGMRRRSTEP